jgi:glycerol-3-phosphate dehydrogenase (NAD(P)+)
MILDQKKILIIGAGAFGTALASCAVSQTNQVTLIARTSKNFATLKLHPKLNQCNLQTFEEFKDDFFQFDLVILAIPCQSLRSVCHWIKDKLRERGMDPLVKPGDDKRLNLISAAKGIEQNTLLLPVQILEDVFGPTAIIGSLSGPSFAKEMLDGLPTCMVFASKNEILSKRTAEILHSSRFRIYNSSDVIGVEIGGALKNIIAMVAGGVDGLKLGNNARAAVITRGLGEMAKIGVQLGADPITFLGLSGVGDLILTCTSDLSRNRQFGLRLSQGEERNEIVASMGGVIEGVTTTQSANQLCEKLGLQSSVLHTAYCVLYEGLPLRQAVHSLINKEQGGEFQWIKK